MNFMKTIVLLAAVYTSISVSHRLHNPARFLHLTPSGQVDPSAPPLFTALFLSASSNESIIVSSLSPCDEFTVRQKGDSLELFWSKLILSPPHHLRGGMDAQVTVDVKLEAVEIKGEDGYEIRYTIDGVTAPSVGLWEVKINSPAFTREEASIIENAGFGVLHSCSYESSCGPFRGVYPQATFQFLATYYRQITAGLYFGAHDGEGYTKTFEHVYWNNGTSSYFSIENQPAGAGKPLIGRTIRSSFPIIARSFTGDWFDAAMIYRRFIIPSSEWTKVGPIAGRKDNPSWLEDLTVWINSHWQNNDIFNVTGGDPLVVKERVTNIARRFNLHRGALALHWYEWDDLGYNHTNYSLCSDEVTCGFDTHYPEYFPARDNFLEVSKELQDIPVRIAPYINGRIFDQAASMWDHDQAHLHACKQSPLKFNASQEELSLYDEEYGSLAVQAVMCPTTPYWQGIISSTVGTLIDDYQMDGVYIDQIAAAGPAPCFDETHNHDIGGGNYWVSGYTKLLEGVRKAAGPNAMILTESNAEPFMAGINIFLTLVGYFGNPAGEDRIIPVFNAVYGGYYISAGAEFNVNHLIPQPDIFAARLTCMYMYGSQLGWFSLGGRDNEKPSMALYDLLMDPHYDSEITYLKLASDHKRMNTRWLTYGRRMRDLPLRVTNSSGAVVDLVRVTDTLVYDVVTSAAWGDLEGNTLLVTIANSDKDFNNLTVEFSISLEHYGVKSAHDCRMISMVPGGEEVEIEFKGGNVTHRIAINGREIISLRIECGHRDESLSHYRGASVVHESGDGMESIGGSDSRTMVAEGNLQAVSQAEVRPIGE